ncbi:hypothetical protein GCM10023091_42700 [Ravibacter arvi]|uniref:PqqD family protein n=2 Tax=Ravibacter arvi TaxID=2051041 RepID=A0ABP8MCD0_9BACT
MTMNSSDNTIYRLSPQLVASEISGETVILDYEAGKYFGLEGVGSFVWSLIQQQGQVSTDDLCEQVMATYDVEEQQCRRDVQALVADLKKNGLIEPVA